MKAREGELDLWVASVEIIRIVWIVLFWSTLQYYALAIIQIIGLRSRVGLRVLHSGLSSKDMSNAQGNYNTE